MCSVYSTIELKAPVSPKNSRRCTSASDADADQRSARRVEPSFGSRPVPGGVSATLISVRIVSVARGLRAADREASCLRVPCEGDACRTSQNPGQVRVACTNSCGLGTKTASPCPTPVGDIACRIPDLTWSDHCLGSRIGRRAAMVRPGAARDAAERTMPSSKAIVRAGELLDSLAREPPAFSSSTAVGSNSRSVSETILASSLNSWSVAPSQLNSTPEDGSAPGLTLRAR